MFRDVPVHAGKVDVQLMYFGGTQHEYHDLEAYMKDNFVTSAHPRHCFALAQQYPDIRAILCEKSKNQFCSIALPRAFPVANASAPNSLFHIHFGEGGARAELVEMWRTTQSWEWFVFLPKQEVIDHPAEFKAAHKVAA
jgi:hypothetical protein